MAHISIRICTTFTLATLGHRPEEIKSLGMCSSTTHHSYIRTLPNLGRGPVSLYFHRSHRDSELEAHYVYWPQLGILGRALGGYVPMGQRPGFRCQSTCCRKGLLGMLWSQLYRMETLGQFPLVALVVYISSNDLERHPDRHQS